MAGVSGQLSHRRDRRPRWRVVAAMIGWTFVAIGVLIVALVVGMWLGLWIPTLIPIPR